MEVLRDHRAARSAESAHCTLSSVRLAPHVVDAHDPFVRACPASVIADLLQNTGGTKPAPVLSAGCLRYLQPALATSAAPVPPAAARRRGLERQRSLEAELRHLDSILSAGVLIVLVQSAEAVLTCAEPRDTNGTAL